MLWSLHVSNELNLEILSKNLSDKDEYVRAWSIQLVSEDFNVPKSIIEKFVSMSKSEKSPVVRMYLASALQRLEINDRWDIASNLVTHAVDSSDANIPFLLWYAIEPIVSTCLLYTSPSPRD